MLRRLLCAAFAASLFLLVVGARLVVVQHYGSDLPEWDQWDAEGLHLLAPWGEHRLTLAELFTPHNEHRVVLTKLLGLAEVLVNGQWDQRLQCVVNAGLNGALAAAVFLFGGRGLDRRWHVPWFVLVAGGFGLPLAWENIVYGFHSQQFFLLATAFGAIVLWPAAAPWSRAWWAGAACAGLALLSMGSGLLAAATVVALIVLRWWHRETTLRPVLPAAVLGAAFVAVGALTRVTVYYHESLKARHLADFFQYLANSLQWPAATLAGFALVVWIPWVWLTVAMVRRTPPAPATNFGRTVWGLGLWVGVQLLATAYARGAGGGGPASRYVDTLVFGLLVNGLALGWLLRRDGPPASPRFGSAVLAGAWALVTAQGLYAQTHQILTSELPPTAAYHTASERHTRDYLATGRAEHLDSPDIPYPGSGAFRVRLDLPALRALMPASVRPPLPLRPGGGAGSVFVESDTRAGTAAPTAPGLSPRTPPLDNRRFWGSFGAKSAGEWRSAPFAVARRTCLKIETAGDAGQPGVSLEIREARTGRPVADVRPSRHPGDSWRAAYAPVPPGEFVVLARVADLARWLAFSEPVEMAPLSYWAWITVKNGPLIAWLGAGAAAVATLGLLWCERMERPPRAAARVAP